MLLVHRLSAIPAANRFCDSGKKANLSAVCFFGLGSATKTQKLTFYIADCYAGAFFNYVDKRGVSMKETLNRPHAVSEFQQMFAHIYPEGNMRYSESDIILRLLEEIAKIMEIARKDDLEALPVQLAKTFSLWNGVATRLKVDLQEVLWYKYPGVCPYCLREKNCICAVEHPHIPNKEQILRKFRRDRQSEPKTLKAHQELHRELYALQNRRIMVIQTAAHLAEEAGEISKEYRHKNHEELCDEMADTGSWMFALANRCNFDLADAVWNLYPCECEKCKQTVCVCHTGVAPEQNA